MNKHYNECCCCKQRKRFRKEDSNGFGMALLFVILLCIPLWGWGVILALYLIHEYKIIGYTLLTLLIIGAFSGLIIAGGKIYEYKSEAEYYNKQRERLEASWPLKERN